MDARVCKPDERVQARSNGALNAVMQNDTCAVRRTLRMWLLLPLIVLALFAATFLLSACAPVPEPAGPSSEKAGATLGSFPASDMSGYACMEGYEGKTMFVDMTVTDILKQMDEGASFAVYAGFDTCPWCNSMLVPLNDEAASRNQLVGYLNTRADSSWKSNADIDGYDAFLQRFEGFVGTDDSGNPHLYAPHVFFISNGEVVGDHAGTVPSQENYEDELSASDIAELRNYYGQGFALI